MMPRRQFFSVDIMLGDPGGDSVKKMVGRCQGNFESGPKNIAVGMKSRLENIVASIKCNMN